MNRPQRQSKHLSEKIEQKELRKPKRVGGKLKRWRKAREAYKALVE